MFKTVQFDFLKDFLLTSTFLLQNYVFEEVNRKLQHLQNFNQTTSVAWHDQSIVSTSHQILFGKYQSS